MKKNVAEPLFVGLLGFLIIFGSGKLAKAQGTLLLSKNADFSTNDREFSREDTLYMKVMAPQIDFTDIDKNEWDLHAENEGDEIEGSFTNHLDGSYTANVDLSVTDPQKVSWRVRVRIEDDSENRFESEVKIKIGDDVIGEQILIQGTIVSLAAESLVVNGITIQVDAETLVLDSIGEIIDFSDLEIGTVVMILATRNNDGDLIAQTIRLSGGGDEITVRGRIQELSDSTLVVVGKEFHADANTEILDDGGNSIQFSDLQIGFLVEIRAIEQADETLLATRIKIDTQGPDEVEFTGTIDLLQENLIIVDGISFTVNNMTEILDKDNSPIPLSALSVGMSVQIRGKHSGMEVLVATRIKVEDDLGNDEVELRGVVTAVGEESLFVAGLEFVVDDNTEIVDEQYRPIDLEQIRVGFVVEVRADIIDSERLATRIEIQERFEDVVEITGAIAEIGETTLVVAGVEFMVTQQTEILDEYDDPIEFQDLEVGQIVEVRAEILNDGEVVATRIRIEDRFSGEVELVGSIDELGEESVVVAGIRFHVNAETEILDRERNPISVSQLEVGFTVEIKGMIQSQGQILATRIEVKDRIEDEVKIIGVIEQIRERYITVLDRTFGLTEHTVIFDADNNIISLSGLYVGQTVEVRGVLLPDGTLVAIRMQVRDANATQIDVVGPIDSFGTNTTEVIGIHFFVDQNTEVLDADNNVIALTDLKVGQTVEVLATGQPNGTRLATRIQVMDVLLISSVVEDVVFNGIRMLDKQVLFDSNTLILGKLNEFWTVEDLAAGQFVEVRAIRGNDNRIFGTKVRYLGTTSVTSILPNPDNKGTQPENFVLHQNYPNPFNPTTTIRFEIPAGSGSAVPAKIVVYNLLGQQVRVLVDEMLAPGVHTVQWNGEDRRGNRMPTGVYIYQLTAGDVKQTRRMLLLQ